MKSMLRPLPPPEKEIEQAFALYFDGAYRRKEGKAAAGIVVFNPAREKVLERGRCCSTSPPIMKLSMQL